MGQCVYSCFRFTSCENFRRLLLQTPQSPIVKAGKNLSNLYEISTGKAAKPLL